MPHQRYYGLAAAEIAQQRPDRDLFAKAYASAMGDAEKTKALYIGMRAEQIEKEEQASAARAAMAREEAVAAQKRMDKEVQAKAVRSGQAQKEADLKAKLRIKDEIEQLYRAYPDARNRLTERALSSLAARYAARENIDLEIKRAIEEQRAFEPWGWAVLIGLGILAAGVVVNVFRR